MQTYALAKRIPFCITSHFFFLPLVFCCAYYALQLPRKGAVDTWFDDFRRWQAGFARDVDKLVCTSDFDRAFILSAISAWYGSKEALRGLRSKWASSGTSGFCYPHLTFLPPMRPWYSRVCWLGNCDMALNFYKGGATWEELLRHMLSFFSFFTSWFWCAFNGIFYLSDKTSSPGGNRPAWLVQDVGSGRE